MSASKKLKARLYPVLDVKPLTVAERTAVVAVVEAAEQITSGKERSPLSHKTGVRPGRPRYIHAWRTRSVLEGPLAALDEALT